MIGFIDVRRNEVLCKEWARPSVTHQILGQTRQICRVRIFNQ